MVVVVGILQMHKLMLPVLRQLCKTDRTQHHHRLPHEDSQNGEETKIAQHFEIVPTWRASLRPHSIATKPPMTWLIHCDGSAIPNPGRMGMGAVWTAPDGTRHSLSHTAPGTGCNNEAEVRALIAALQALQSQGADGLLLHCDNSVVVAQVGSHTARPIPRLAPLFDQARALLASFADARLVWIPGHRNGEADALARAALGMWEPRVVKARKKRR